MTGAEIRRAREAAGFKTHEAAAEAIGVGVDTYRSWESGKRNPKPASVKMIRDAFERGAVTQPDDDELRRQVEKLALVVELLVDEARGRLGVESDFAARLAALEAVRDQRSSR